MFVFRWLFYFAIFGTVTSSIYCALVVLAARRFNKKRVALESAPLEFLPPVSVLKPLHGADPGLAENLEGYFHQTYPLYEILFCARHDDDAGLQCARKVAARHPQVPVRFIACGEPQFPNPKMFSLAVMAEAATYDLLVTSDADCRVTPEYLARCVQELVDPHIQLSSCIYLGIPLGNSLAARLDALGKSVEMSSGVLVAIMFAGADFALGVTQIVRREAFAQAGGYEDLGNYWAEDFVLGNRLAAQGKGVRISPHVIGITVAEVEAEKSFRDQLRWMQSTRRSRPLGHLGTGLTFAVPFGLLGLFAGLGSHHAIAGLLLLLISCVNRFVQAASVLSALGMQRWQSDASIYPVRDLTGFIIWVCSYLPFKSHYHGGKFDLTADGRLIKPIQN